MTGWFAVIGGVVGLVVGMAANWMRDRADRIPLRPCGNPNCGYCQPRAHSTAP